MIQTTITSNSYSPTLTPDQFIYWLEGFLEAKATSILAEDVKTIQAKMKLVRQNNFWDLYKQPNIFPAQNPPSTGNPPYQQPSITWCSNDKAFIK